MRSGLAVRLISGTTRWVPGSKLREVTFFFNKNLLPSAAGPYALISNEFDAARLRC
jgi:hypothetical protein